MKQKKRGIPPILLLPLDGMVVQLLSNPLSPPPPLFKVSLTVHHYRFTTLGGEGHSTTKVFCPRTQLNLARDSNLDSSERLGSNKSEKTLTSSDQHWGKINVIERNKFESFNCNQSVIHYRLRRTNGRPPSFQVS